MRISVLIPTYNSAALVGDAVASALAQTTPAAEIIVVDDGSTDDTWRRLLLFGDRVRYVHQQNQGVAAARNRGLACATGDVVAFLDADDVWHPRKLELQSAILAARPALGLLGTRTFAWPVAAMPAVAIEPRADIAPVPLRQLMVKNQFTTSTVLVRRAVLDRVGGFDTALHGPEDYDLWLRVAEQIDAANLLLPLTGYRSLPGSLSKQAHSMEAGMQAILHKLDGRHAWQGERWLRRRAYGFCELSCAFMYHAAGEESTAFGRLLRSFAWHPLPFRREEVPIPFARLRLLRKLSWGLLRQAAAAPAVGLLTGGTP